ncbi:MAG: aminomethyltransferase family protein [Candidatus Poribacteria bacterium]|nr:aminomethyltransferase family protein [Candidatus Poribacteria bacterium]
MKRTPLYQTHRALGATFAEVCEGWELVTHFTGPQQEHHAVRKAVGVLDLSHRGRLRFTGEDRAKYLHRIISNDVEGLNVGEGNYATILTNRGKIITDMWIHVFEDAIGVETNAETAVTLYRELDKYLIADDVTIEDLTDETGAIGVHGPKSADLLQDAFGLDVGGLPEHHSVLHQIGEQSVACIRANETGEIGYNLHTASTSMEWLWDTILTKGRALDAQPVGMTALHSLRIEAGIPRYGAELADSIIPLEAELECAISFEKGCYIGQEIVARMKFRGHPNRLLRGLALDHDTPPQRGDLIFDGEKEIGWITSAIQSPTLGKTIAMGYVRTAFTDSGSRVEVETADGRVNATVALLPFYKS